MLTGLNSLKFCVTRRGVRHKVCCEVLDFLKNAFAPTAHARGPFSLPAGVQMFGYRAHRNSICSVGRTFHLLVCQFQDRCIYSTQFFDVIYGT